MTRYLRCTLGFLLILPLCLALGPAHADQQYQRDLIFKTSNQSMWASGPQYVASYSADWIASWDNQSSGGSFYDITIPGFCIPAVVVAGVTITPEKCFPSQNLGTFGAEASVSTSGKIGLRPHLNVSGGAVSVNYPVQVTIEYPDAGTLYPGDPFTITTSFDPITGLSLSKQPTLSTTSPHAQVTVDGILSATFTASANVKAFSDTLFNGSLNVPSIGPFDEQILDTDSSFFQDLAKGAQALVNYELGSLTGGAISGKFKNLSIDTAGGLLPNSVLLGSSNQETFFTTKLDYSNAALTAAGLPAFEKNISVDVGSDASFNANFQLLDAFERIDFKIGQRFGFNPHPIVTLQLSNGETIALPVERSIQLAFPTVSPGARSNNLTFAPTFSLDAGLTNRTDLHITPSYNFTPLDVSYSGKAGGNSLGSFSLNPVGTLTLFAQDNVIPLFDQRFPLEGFLPATTAPFTLVGYTYPTPTLTSVSPAAFKPGATMQLTAVGTNFVPSHTKAANTLPSTTAQWHGSDRATQYGSDTQLTFTLSPEDASTEGIVNVTAANPAPGGGPSNAKPVIIDGTPPVTTSFPSGPRNANNHGWYNGNVTASLSTTDPLSGVHEVDYQTDGGTLQHVLTGAPLGPGTFATPNFTVSGDAKHVVSYQSDDNVGNAEAQKSQEIDIDGTPPTITGSRSLGANQNGWNNAPVTVHFDCSDVTSGIFNCTPDMTLSGEGSNQSVAGTAVDNAGNSASTQVSGINIDLTPPVTTASLSGPQNLGNNHGWYTGPVTVSMSSTDTLSGVSKLLYSVDGTGHVQGNSAPPGPGTLAVPGFTVSLDGSHVLTYAGDDYADNVEAQKSTAVKIDGTPPTITGSRSPGGNWSNAPVTVHFNCSDAIPGSGIFSCTPDTRLTGEGSNQSATGTAVDNAGNSASATVNGINIDLTPPAITYSGNAGTYTVDQQVNISCSSADPNLADRTPGSGVLSDTCKPITGSASSFALGMNTFSASATDVAGNVGTASTSFTVRVTYDSLCSLIGQFLAKNGVTDTGLGTSLCAKLTAAQAAAARGDLTTKSNILAAFVNEVQAQTGKAFAIDQAAALQQAVASL
jgi:hypothetical protein